jgi:hypothetical protein
LGIEWLTLGRNNLSEAKGMDIIMKILSSSGLECVKKLPTSPEDFFNQSEVSYDHNGQRRILKLTYVRYFEQYMEENGIYNAEEMGLPFYHIAALLILMKNNGYVDGDQLYYNSTDRFLASFNQDDIPEAISMYKSL